MSLIRMFSKWQFGHTLVVCGALLFICGVPTMPTFLWMVSTGNVDLRIPGAMLIAGAVGQGLYALGKRIRRDDLLGPFFERYEVRYDRQPCVFLLGHRGFHLYRVVTVTSCGPRASRKVGVHRDFVDTYMINPPPILQE